MPLNPVALDSILKLARFDAPIIGWRERGAVLTGEINSNSALATFRIREPDGSDTVTTIDREKLVETSSVTRGEFGLTTEETRYADHRQVGVLKVAHRQERFVNGALQTTVEIHELTLEPGLLDRFFSPPDNLSLDFMDYVGALAVVRERAKDAGSSTNLTP